VRSYLDGSVVDEETIESRESLGGAIGMLEGDVGNTTTDTTGRVVNLHLLNLTDCLLEVLLSVEIDG